MIAADIAARSSELTVEVVETTLGRALVVRLGGAHEVLSWAIVNGGRSKTDSVVWREVGLAELGPAVDPGMLLRETLSRVGAPRAVGLLTARNVRRYEIERVERDGIVAECVATVGLSNLVAVGDPSNPGKAGDPPSARRESAGTINLVCRVSVGLAEEALLEAMSIATEARTASMLKVDLRSPSSGQPATGTGTDCIVVAAPTAMRAERFAGKHTACGSAIGAAVLGAVSRGVARWLEERSCPTT